MAENHFYTYDKSIALGVKIDMNVILIKYHMYKTMSQWPLLDNNPLNKAGCPVWASMGLCVCMCMCVYIYFSVLCWERRAVNIQ